MLVETFLRTYRRINMNWQRTGVALVALFAAAASYAYSAIVSISELTAKSRLVVLARVISIRESRTALGPEKRATAKVLEAWKGAPADHIDNSSLPRTRQRQPRVSHRALRPRAYASGRCWKPKPRRRLRGHVPDRNCRASTAVSFPIHGASGKAKDDRQNTSINPPPNFTLKLSRPGFGPAAELPTSSPA